MPDIVYLTADKQFTRHINTIAVERGLVQEEDISDDEVDLNAVTQFVSPIVASQGMLSNELNNPYSSISCEDGFIFVLKELGEHLYIAINGDGEEEEEFLFRKLQILHRLIELLYGPVAEKLRGDSHTERCKSWSQMTSLINTWVRLYKEEQAYLLEAVERLHVNQSLSELCINLLENSLTKMKSTGERNPAHALLTVKSKLLALYSSKNASELQSSDLLLIMLVVQDMYPSTQTINELLATQPRKEKQKPATEGASVQPDEYVLPSEDLEGDADVMEPESEVIDPETEANDEESEASAMFRSSLSTPPPRGRSPSSSPTQHTSTPEISVIHAKTSIEVDAELHHGSMLSPITSQGESLSAPLGVSPSPYIQRLKLALSEATTRGQQTTSEDELSFLERSTMSYQDESFGNFHVLDSSMVSVTDKSLPSQRLPVFLKSIPSSHKPHELHVIQVLPDTVLVILTENKSSMSGFITRSLSILEAIVKITNKRGSSNVNARHVIEILDDNIKKVCDVIKKFKGTSIENTNFVLIKKWLNVKGHGLVDYLESNMSLPMSPRLENSISELIKYLKYIFRLRFLSPRQRSCAALRKYNLIMTDIEYTIKGKLCHYKDYLSVKGQRNVTMTAYMEDFPGLVHFIYVDRTVDVLTAPSLNSSCDTSKDDSDPTQLLKSKIWQMVRDSHRYLQKGFISMTKRDGDYHYSYFIWFEDNSGNPLPIQQAPRLASFEFGPGIIASHFYSKLTRQCFPNAPIKSVHCYELMCMHVGVVPVQFAINHCQNLASVLWETSGEPNSPISLL
uniref:Hermansky-Pudlak syndrome 1 protein-like n=1 Tax=Saccoglossus kowalevskii TaxID=10224 RepID=A0ABM0MCK4_SACKO|nr:PREDICTED: Hermansky-Pudlak syndrome 1 protein-like [Saccoglossus kowalevskii]